MKKILLCFALLGASSMSHSMSFLGFTGMMSFWMNRDIIATEDVCVAYLQLPWANNNYMDGFFTVDSTGVLTGASFDKKAVLVGVSNRAIVATVLMGGGLYLAYKAYWSKKQKSKTDEELQA